MNGLRSMIAVAALAFTMPAQAATTDPEVIIYRVSGVFDSGGAGGQGTATSFHCTNFSGAAETIRFVVRSNIAGILANTAFTVLHLTTTTVSTKDTSLYPAEVILGTGFVQGTAAIAATSVNITCTAHQVDASSVFSPIGIALHMTRFNPVPGTQE